jgi:hypothetical protein
VRVLLLGLSVCASVATAQVQQLGDGKDGPLEVTAPNVIINRHAPLAGDAMAGDTRLTVVDATPFRAGMTVLVVQSRLKSDGERGRVGEFSVHTVERVVGPVLELGQSLTRAWRLDEAQVVTVPEYTDVTVAAGASLVAPPWDGRSGGVLAFFAAGRLLNDGTVSAEGLGFRGGTARDAPEQDTGCTRDDERAPRGSERGEGALQGADLGVTGRGFNDSGGGGGVCRASGGGGGAGLGQGGQGGVSDDGRRDVGGLGGEPLTASGLHLGGGGGAANGALGRGRNGGRGGGAMLVRARTLDGAGAFVASGEPGGSTDGREGAGGGGGGAGGIVIEVVDDARCAVRAEGGAGGAGTTHGAGGGGGGGHVSVRARRIVECPISVAGGLEGAVTSGTAGAQPGGEGRAAAREVSEQRPFPSGPGATLERLGCGCHGGFGGLGASLATLLLGATRRWRRRSRLRPSWRAGWGLVAVLALLGASCQPVCGQFGFSLVETPEVDERVGTRAVEVCGDDVGTQGNWVPGGESFIAFQPDTGTLDANFAFTNMFITVVFRTADVVAGATVPGRQLGGVAFYGLGRPRRLDESSLVRESSRLVFHAVGDEDPADTSLFRRRVIDLEWDLVWANSDARWTASGRDRVPMLREAR